MNKHKVQTLINLARLGISDADALALCRAERVLHKWAEDECNGIIQRDEETGVPYLYSEMTHRRMERVPDREAGALKRIAAIVANYLPATPDTDPVYDACLSGFYHQTDPRGCALYLLRPGDVPEGQDPGAYYSRGVAVVGG